VTCKLSMTQISSKPLNDKTGQQCTMGYHCKDRVSLSSGAEQILKQGDFTLIGKKYDK